MRSTWQLRSGTRPIGLREGATAHEALFDVRSLGCRARGDHVGTDALLARCGLARAVRMPGGVLEDRRAG